LADQAFLFNLPDTQSVVLVGLPSVSGPCGTVIVTPMRAVS
jgi:hypothetical protein